MPKFQLSKYIKIVLIGAALYGFVNVLWIGSHDNRKDQDEEAYLDGLLQAVSKPRPPQSQRKLSNIHDSNQRPYHLSLYDLDSQVADSAALHCIMTQTQPLYHICIHPTFRDVYISESLYESGVWEPYITPVIQRALNKYPDAMFVDIGANIGYYTLMAAKMGHQVIAVEPAYDNFQRLHMGAKLNKLTHKISGIFNAVSDNHENVTLTVNYENQGGIRVRPLSRSQAAMKITGKDKQKVIHTTTIDHLLELGTFTQAIIKVDIEGFECKALAGARRFFKQINVPYIFMEWKKMFVNRNKARSPCPTGAIERMTHFFTSKGYIPYEVRTGFQLNPARSATAWKIGDLYWRHKNAKVLQGPF